jgi:hypothetical protein
MEGTIMNDLYSALSGFALGLVIAYFYGAFLKSKFKLVGTDIKLLKEFALKEVSLFERYTKHEISQLEKRVDDLLEGLKL